MINSIKHSSLRQHGREKVYSSGFFCKVKYRESIDNAPNIDI